MFTDGTVDCSFEDILAYTTASTAVPILGFDICPMIKFNHPADLSDDRQILAGFPISNSCALQIFLPLLDTYEEFQTRMVNTVTIVKTFTNN